MVPPVVSERFRNRGQITIAAGISDQATQGQTQQVGGGDHLQQVSRERGGGVEPIGTVGVALKDDLNSGAVDLNVGDGGGLFGGEGAKEGAVAVVMGFLAVDLIIVP